MGVMEIILIILGVAVFILSFLLPAGKKDDMQSAVRIDEDMVKELVEKEVEDAKSKIGDIVDETITYAMEKTERSMDRLTNEKIMAVNEYSDTVLGEIHKNHKEVVFLYDMLNDKHETLKTALGEAAKTASEVKQTVKDAEITAMEAQAKAKEAQEAVSKALSSSRNVNEESGYPEKVTIETGSSVKEEVKAEEKEFTPIVAPKVEILYQPPQDLPSLTEETNAKEKPKKNNRKPKAAKTARKENEVPAEVPEVAVSLDTSGKAGKRNNNERILELHKAGKSNMAIAKELSLGIGEVKLVIDLFEGM